MTERESELLVFFERGKSDKKSGKYNPPQEADFHASASEKREAEEEIEEYDRGYEEEPK